MNTSQKPSSLRSNCPIYCEHANEMPIFCPCADDCYCRVHGNCKTQVGLEKKERKEHAWHHPDRN